MKNVLKICLMILVVAGCSHKNVEQMKFSGTLEITEHKLGSKVAGRVVGMSVKEGDMVKCGQVIATLDRYEQASKDYERLLRLLEHGGANRQAVELAQLNMQDQQIVSPIDGVVLVKVTEVGETVQAGGPVVVLGDPQDKWIKIYVPEGVVNQIALGNPVTVSFDGISQKYQGKVRYIAHKAEFTPRNVQTPQERVTQDFAVKVSLDEQQVNAHPGVAADVRFGQKHG